MNADRKMKTYPFGIKDWLLSCGTGVGVFLLVSSLIDSSKLEPVATVLLWPGAALATVIGFGGHDWQGFVLYFGGNLVL